MRNHNNIKNLCTLLLILFVPTSSVLAVGAGAFVPVDVTEVKVGGEIGRRIDNTISNNVLVLDSDKDFLLPFRQRDRMGGYIGLGKFIDSMVRFAAYSNDKQVLALKKHVVEEAIKTQEDDGYIGICVPEKRMWSLWDIHEMAYIVLGLTADYKYFREQSSLRAAGKLADYIIRRWSDDPSRTTDGWISVHVATTGLEEAMLALHEQSGERQYLDFCINHRKLPDWNVRLIEGRWGNLEGHAYHYLCRCLAQLRLNRIQPDPRLLTRSRETLDFLLKEDGLLIPGLCGYHECWHSNQQGFFKLGETCATAYLIRWLDALLQVEGASLYGDLMERAIYNGLFAAQSPDGRRLRYYAPFEGPRVYFDGDTYCCPCNFRRIIAELPGMIYYRCQGGIAVNLYAESSADFSVSDDLSLELRQVTDYPNSGNVLIHLTPSKAARFAVRLRIPHWCDEATATINQETEDLTAQGGSFLTIERTWRPGDRIKLEMPMAWRLIKGRKSQAGRVAVMRGPMLFGLNPDRQENFDPDIARLMLIDADSPELSGPEDSVRPGDLACKARFWNPNNYNAQAKADIRLVLTEYADPGCRATYFLVPNPKAEILQDDELVLNTY
ncbi:MAG: beta-L-arabinofuranosidase domain-containing protein [Planctomycetota bacterium]